MAAPTRLSAAVTTEHRTVAFALSGGANLGPMQAGTVLALMEAGVRPDILVGTSVGALNAAFLSTRPGVTGAETLVAAWSALRRREAFRFNAVAVLAGFVGLRDHLVSTRTFRQLIRRWIEIDRLEEAPLPIAVTATDALTGRPVVLREGDAVDALMASAAIPGLFPPVRIDGRWLVDGSLSAGRPALQAQDLGADEIYVISTTTAAPLRPPRGAVAMAMRSVALVTTQAAEADLRAAVSHAGATGGSVHVIPSPEPPAPGPFDFAKGDALAEAAYQRTMSWLAERSDVVAPGPGAT